MPQAVRYRLKGCRGYRGPDPLPHVTLLETTPGSDPLKIEFPFNQKVSAEELRREVASRGTDDRSGKERGFRGFARHALGPVSSARLLTPNGRCAFLKKPIRVLKCPESISCEATAF